MVQSFQRRPPKQVGCCKYRHFLWVIQWLVPYLFRAGFLRSSGWGVRWRCRSWARPAGRTPCYSSQAPVGMQKGQALDRGPAEQLTVDTLHFTVEGKHRKMYKFCPISVSGGRVQNIQALDPGWTVQQCHTWSSWIKIWIQYYHENLLDPEYI